MKLRVTLQRPGGAPAVDVIVSAEAGADVGGVAETLALADPLRVTRPSSSLSLRVVGPGGDRVVAPSSPLERAGIRSGSVVSIVDTAGRFDDSADDRPVAAVLIVESGPDAGKQFPLHPGSNFIGRGAGNDISLADPLVSKNHARVDITDVIEIVDRGSVNGVVIRDAQIDRAFLQADDQVLLGDTTVRVVPRHLDTVTSTGSALEFNRSPRLDPIYPDKDLDAPEPPTPPNLNPMPLVVFLAPLVFGAVLYAVTRNPTTVLFVALSPLLMIGNVVEQRIMGKRSYKRAVELFRHRLGLLGEELERETAAEIAGRLHEHPSVAETFEAARLQNPLLWTRRPDRHGFLTMRLGLGRLPSRTTVEVGNTRDATPELAAELQAVVDRFAVVDGVPVVADLRSCGALGVAGQRPRSLPTAAGYVMQLAALHSPAEVVLCAIASSTSAADWQWLRWLPHTHSDHSPLTVSLADSTPAAVALVSELEALIETRSGVGTGGEDHFFEPSIVVLIENDAPIDRNRLVELAELGPKLGVHVLWHAPSVAQLPAACTTFVTTESSANAGSVGLVDDGTLISPVVLETLEPRYFDAVGRMLAPVVDAGARVDDASSVPRSVSLLTLLDTSVARDPQAVLDRWHQSFSVPGTGRKPDESFDRGLRAIVGVGAAQELTLDLRAHGPHALVGGTTGSGKSEFLQSWVAALAASYSPARLTFLFVDYKGGSAFRDCLELPHTVGIVTDLTPHLVQRALISLNAELHHRERLLERKRAKDLIELERVNDPETPPSLVIVVDEFAALVTEVPEFVDGVVNVAQRGRSLGLHLILATQRPAGVIKDNLRANTNLRIALRMADEDDSENVVGTQIAATFAPDIPGRGVVKSGPSRLQVFQSGYVGGWTPDVAPPPEITIDEIRFGPVMRWVLPKTTESIPEQAKGPTDLRRLVDAAKLAFTATSLPAPRKPWLKELDDRYDLTRMRQSRTDSELFFAVLDEPRNQMQREIAFVPDSDGSIAIIGTGGSGKTATLRTLAISAGLSTRGGPCHVYGIDFGGRGLQMLEPLPHVGAIVPGDDHERLTRLLRFVRQTIDDRAVRFANARAGSISEYRQLASQPDEPRLLLLIDGMSAFRSAYEAGDRFRWIDMLNGVVADGRQVGVHLAVTADRVNAIPSALASGIQRRLILRLANEQEYAMAEVPADALIGAPPGRGLYNREEIQVAVLGGSANVQIQAKAIEKLAAEMRRSFDRPPPMQVGRLADRVLLSELPPNVSGLPALGIADADLAPIGWTPTPLLVVGPPSSGRTTTLASLALSFQRSHPTACLAYIGSRRSALWSMPAWKSRADGVDEADALCRQLADDIQFERMNGESLLVVVENIADLVEGLAEMSALNLVKASISHGVGLVCDLDISASTYAQVLALLKAQRHGIALQPEQHDGDQIFRTAFPRVDRGEFPPGRGFYVRQGRAHRVQVALPDLGA